jgi:polysaccharide deacetylase family protein (PEP-CTERM system associated)
VVPTTRLLLELLDRSGVKATFFVLGQVAEQFPALIEEVADRGHELGVHGYSHRFVYRLTRDEFAREIDRSVEALQRITGRPPQGHRAPYFSVNARTPWAFDVLAERGFRYDSSVFPVRSLIYGYPGAKREPHSVGAGGRLIELPMSTVRVGGYNVPVAGGFYARTYPFPLLQWALRRLEREGLPAIMYVHPWELDLEQPRTKVTLRERVTHFHGRAGLLRKLERLFEEFRFGTMADLVDAIPK